ncbi:MULTISPECIES: hypothetical protein [Cupriavidus]|uniref:Uncharacterized protein n=5 Tax=Cupriavidus TaxID=106589 RepID=A0A7Z7NQA8_9BURK|nr:MULTISPECIES: hypothetical protein [Cupriavidus]ALD90619.1 hypothetical protein CR3_1387 [Cupriavidus gilardii CR3]AMR78502.1 hypothetical protein A2G96_12565 [Cupriavidus nantongensis]KAA6119552.1 hypothetical protein F1599_18785 [Cupriavidus cauae]MCT9015580.1 hypothetical protein [Cupriavidus gilardii]MCT9055350.1 hypothetical protein [Cupriavidus gilardii]
MNRCLIALVLLFGCGLGYAAPGAHGPSGEHLDAPAATSAGTTRPTIEANTEAFELVGTLYDDELSILVDRYATNEPVTAGTLEVELGEIKAQAKLHADLGDFSFTDAALLKALQAPGQHALVFTLVAGAESDLIEGRITVGGDEHGHDHVAWKPWAGAAIAVVLALGLFVMIRRYRRRTGAMNR